MLGSRVVEIVCGAIGIGLLGVVIYTGLQGTQSPAANFAPTFVFVIFWIGLVPASVLFGDIFRAFNPWRALGRAIGWGAGRVVRPAAGALTYPERLGHWPAAAGVFAFAVLELVRSGGDQPDTVAIATLVYSAITFVAMALYGVEAWSARRGVLRLLQPVLAHVRVRDTRPRARGQAAAGRPRPPPGRRGDGGAAGRDDRLGHVRRRRRGALDRHLPDMTRFFGDLGLSPQPAFELTFLIGLIVAILLVASLYRLGVLGARSVGGGFSAEQLSRAFVHSLVPIASAYVMAHYLTYLAVPRPAIVFLASDPLGDGSDLFGTASTQIDYGVIGSTATWYWQVAFVVAGHAAGLTLAHDRALALYDDPKLAVRSQYWMLAVMVAFTSLALAAVAGQHLDSAAMYFAHAATG